MTQRSLYFFPCRVAVAVLVLVLGYGAQARGQVRHQTEVKTITLGVVSEVNRASVVDQFRDFVAYVARRMGTHSPPEGKVILAPTPFQLAQLIEQKRVDFFFESPYPTYVIDYVHGVGRPILRRWRGGMAEYQSLIFTARNGISKLDELRGQTIAFEDPSSTSGYLLPKHFLQRRGFRLVEKAGFDPNASAADVRYLFAYSQDKLLEWVFAKQAAAGAISNDDLASLDTKTKKEIVVLAETERLPRHLVSVRTDLAPAIVERIEKILLGMHEDNDGRRVLKQIGGTSKFDALPGGEPALRRLLAQAFSTPAKH